MFFSPSVGIRALGLFISYLFQTLNSVTEKILRKTCLLNQLQNHTQPPRIIPQLLTTMIMTKKEALTIADLLYSLVKKRNFVGGKANYIVTSLVLMMSYRILFKMVLILRLMMKESVLIERS